MIEQNIKSWQCSPHCLTRTLFERHNLLLSVIPDFCCAFGCSNKRKTSWKSNISYYWIPFATDPESLSLRKRWTAAIRRENWTDDQIDNSRICSKHFISVKSKKTVMVSRSLVFWFVTVLLVWREYLHVFIVLHWAHSRLLVSIQMYFSVVIKITTRHCFLHQ